MIPSTCVSVLGSVANRNRNANGSDSTHWRSGFLGNTSSAQERGAVRHPPGAAGGAEAAAFATERDELLGLTVLAAHAQKTVLEATALQVRRELLLDVLR